MKRKLVIKKHQAPNTRCSNFERADIIRSIALRQPGALEPELWNQSFGLFYSPVYAVVLTAGGRGSANSGGRRP